MHRAAQNREAVPLRQKHASISGRCRVALGGCPPRAPTDPDVPALEHPVPQVTPSLRHNLASAVTNPYCTIRRHCVDTSGSSMPSRCCLPTGELLDASLPIHRVLAGRVPRLPRYYQGTATSCRPSRRASFPSLGGTTGPRIVRSRRRCVWQRRAWGCSPGIPVRECFRGDDRISQVPGEPRFPFAHVLRPRPAPACLTLCGASGVAPALRTTKTPTIRTISRLNSMAFGLAVYASRCRLPFLAQDSLPGAGQALLGGLLPARSLYKVSNHVIRFSSLSKLLGATWVHPILFLSFYGGKNR